MDVGHDTTVTPWKLGHRPALDGLRGLAVLLVMIYHGPGEPLHGGFFGVDIFFVLSGFLITSLLVREFNATGRVELRRFWLRRTLRLVPALLGLCACIMVVAVGSGELWLAGGMPAVLLYVANWARMAGTLVGGPLTHTWSLAIEEQFYLAWPLVLGVLLRRSPRFALGVTLSAALASALWRAWLWEGPASYLRVYNGFDTRADGLLLGCALALAVSMGMLQRLPAPLVRWSARLALLGLAAAVVLSTDMDAGTYRWGTAGVGLATAILVVALATTPDPRLVRWFSIRPLVAAGTLSYGLYLWNLPVNYFLGNGFELLPPVLGAPLAVAVTWLMAHLSRRLVEEPALRLRDRLDVSRPRASPASGRGSRRAAGRRTRSAGLRPPRAFPPPTTG